MAPTAPMDLRFTPEQERFRAEVRAWLEANVPPPARGDRPAPVARHRGRVRGPRAWERTMFDARWSVVSSPEEYGGRGAGLFEWLIFEEEYYRAGAPTGVGQNGIFLLAPTLFEFGTPEQKGALSPRHGVGEEIWCQGWSEPDAGSDLAAIRSRAERRSRHRRSGHRPAGGSSATAGTGYLGPQRAEDVVLRGAFADWVFGLFRSDPEAERHRGLTYFLVKMDSPGVTVRPIAQLDGETGFAEVFFEDVEVPDAQVLGAVGEGWKVAMATAGSERGLSLRSPARYTEAAADWSSCTDGARGGPGRRGPQRRRRGTRRVDAEAYRLHTYWTATRVVDGGTSGPSPR